MSKERKDNSFIKKPVYEGGSAALKKFVKENLQYPKQAISAKIEGSVNVRFEINRYGKVGKTKVISSLGYGCDEEAIRLVKLLQFQVPQNPRKLKVLFHKKLTIHFNLPKPKPKPKQAINYEIVTPKVNLTTDKKKKSYGYKISI